MNNLNNCGCCEGLSVQIPVEQINRSGKDAITYRVGTHTQFKQSLLARLLSVNFPALQELKTRDDDDFSIAFLDAWATLADVLTFYQERIANESYLRTATERLSILELARLIGYKLSPGVAASTYLAFTLEDAPSAPGQATIDIGTKVQSIPGPGEKPQTFETVEKIEAKAEWNALKPKMTQPQKLDKESTKVYLKGVRTNLKTGDGLLFIGKERENDPGNENWDFRRIDTVEVNREAGYTVVTWQEKLGSDYTLPAAEAKVYVMRQRAALFGHNAPDWRSMPNSIKREYGDSSSDDTLIFGDDTLPSGSNQWPEFTISEVADVDNNSSPYFVHLDDVYPQIVQNSWLVFSISNWVEVYQVEFAVEDSRPNFTLTNKTTRLKLSGENLNKFNHKLRETVVFAQSKQLELAEVPRTYAVTGDSLLLEGLIENFQPKQRLLVSGKRQRVRVSETAENLFLTSEDGSQTLQLKPGDSLQILAPPQLLKRQFLFPKLQLSETVKNLFLTSEDGSQTLQLKPGDSLQVLAPPQPLKRRFLFPKLQWHLKHYSGFQGFLTVSKELSQIVEEPATDEDETVSEVIVVKQTSSEPEQTQVQLIRELKNYYDRSTVKIYGNVALATHGETVTEVLGNGDATQAYQQFTLQKSPLTYVSSENPSGAESTLNIRVNDILCQEVPTFYQQEKDARIFVTKTNDEGKTTVQFGNQNTGGKQLPTGQENVQATYRQGIGLEGLVKPEQLSLLITRPLGVRGVTNPLAATGAADPESRDAARQNAPLTVLTLDRLVSLQDYEDFTRAFAGIEKALATWTWNAQVREVFVTIAGEKGQDIPEDSNLYKKLVTAIQKAGDPYVLVRVKTYEKIFFRLAAKIKVDSDYLPEKVLNTVKQTLLDNFSFSSRQFGQVVTQSEVIAVIQAISGVVAIDLDQLYRLGEAEKLNPRLPAAVPKVGSESTITAAELLVLDQNSLENVGVMT